MGVWIEIMLLIIAAPIDIVTPCVGVWIEILTTIHTATKVATSLPAWGCGLK